LLLLMLLLLAPLHLKEEDNQFSIKKK